MIDYSSFAGAYAGRTVLLTGHTGFKGGWLASWLAELGAEVIGFSDSVPTTPSFFDSTGLAERVIDVRGDIRNRNLVAAAIQDRRPDYVFHLAAQPIVAVSYADPLNTISTNVIGTANILDSLRNVNWPIAVVVVTSDKCYENNEWYWGYRETDAMGGKDPYSASKGAAEILFQSFVRSYFASDATPVRVASARAGNVVGGGDWAPNRLVPDCMRSWTDGGEVVLRAPDATRPWQHVLEPVSGYLSLAAQLYDRPELSGQSFNFGPKPDTVLTVQEVVKRLAAMWTRSTPTVKVDSNAATFKEARLLQLVCDKARIELGWTPRLSANETLTMTGSWYDRHAKANSRVQMRDITLEQIRQFMSMEP